MGQPDEYRRLNLRAGALYTDLGDDDAAVYHFLRGEEPDRAIQIVKTVSDAYYAQGQWERLASWLGRLPQKAVERDSDLLLLSGQVTLRLGDPTGSLEQLDKLIAGPHGKDPQVLGKALVAKSTSYRRLGHFDKALKAAEDGLTTLRGINCLPEIVSEAYKQIGDAFNGQGEYERAEQSFLAGLALISRESLRLFSLISNDLGVTYLEQGKLGQAVIYLDQARVGLARLGNQGQLAETLTNLALVYFHKGEFDLALEEVDEALRAVQAVNYPRILATALMHQGMVRRALGAYADSINSFSQGLKLARQILDQRLIAGCTDGLGAVYRKLGDTSKAEVLLSQALFEAEDSGQKYIVAVFHISLGKLYCQTSSYSKALEHLKLAEEQLIALKTSRRVAEAKLFQAAVYYRTNKRREALEILTQVSDLISRSGYGGFLLADSDAVLDVIRLGAARRVGGDTYTHLVARLTEAPALLEEPDPGQAGDGEFARYPTLRAFSFGHPWVMLDAHQVTDTDWQSRKAKELFFFLCYNSRVLTNEEIIDNLWPEASVDLSRGALRTNVFRIRQALYYDCIIASGAGYRINPAIAVEFDTERFLRHLNQAADLSQSDEARERHLEEAVALYHGPFLSGIDSEWCQVLSANLAIKHHTALINLARYRTCRMDFAGAASLLESVVTTDPYNEEAQFQLIANSLEAGETASALQQLRYYAKLCMEDMGADLPPRFLQMHCSGAIL